MAPKTKTETVTLDDKTKNAAIRFMKAYGVESVTTQGTVFTPDSLGSSSKDGKKEKDPNAPKLPKTSYQRFQTSFSEDDRKEMLVKAKKQGITYAKFVSNAWKALGEDGQKEYKDAYDEDKKEYDVAKEKYLSSKKEVKSEIPEEDAEVEEEEVEEEKEEEVVDAKEKPKEKKKEEKKKTSYKIPEKKRKGPFPK